MGYFLGIDQGGTKTEAVLVGRGGDIPAFGRSGGACYISSGMETAMGKIGEATKAALAAAALSPDDIEMVVSCMTGADWAFEYGLLEKNLQKLFPGKRITVQNDAIAALRGGSDAPESGIVVMGTGGNIALQNRAGEQFIYGYYMPETCHGASGFGQRAFNAVMEASVGLSPPTLLTELILAHTGESTPEGLLMKTTMGKMRIEHKNLSPLVFEAADRGDATARQMVAELAHNLSRCVLVAAGRLKIDLDGFELVLSGGMFKSKGYLLSEALRERFKIHPGIKITDAKYEPVVGAGLICLDLAYGRHIPEAVMGTVEKDCTRLGLVRNFS